MKSIYIILLIIFTLSCQREERNQLGVGYNKTLIMPPTNDLPTPTSIKEDKSTIKNSNNNVINSILDQSNMEEIDLLIIDKIDDIPMTYGRCIRGGMILRLFFFWQAEIFVYGKGP